MSKAEALEAMVDQFIESIKASPKSEEAKAASSQNAITHGLCSAQIIHRSFRFARVHKASGLVPIHSQKKTFQIALIGRQTSVGFL